MTKDLIVRTDISGARALERIIRRESQEGPPAGIDAGNPLQSGNAVLVAINDLVAWDDFRPFQASLLHLNGNQFVRRGGVVSVRNLSGMPLLPHWRHIAAPVSNLGLCIYTGQRQIQCELTEDLFAAVNSKTDPSTAIARIRLYRENGDQYTSDMEVDIVNRFENISIDAGVYMTAKWMEREWQPDTSDCPGGGSSSDSGSVA